VLVVTLMVFAMSIQMFAYGFNKWVLVGIVLSASISLIILYRVLVLGKHRARDWAPQPVRR